MDLISSSSGGCTNGDIRLRGSTTSYTGRVEICHKDAWGTVCDDFWSTSDAQVACRQLGFSPIGTCGMAYVRILIHAVVFILYILSGICVFAFLK